MANDGSRRPLGPVWTLPVKIRFRFGPGIISPMPFKIQRPAHYVFKEYEGWHAARTPRVPFPWPYMRTVDRTLLLRDAVVRFFAANCT